MWKLTYDQDLLYNVVPAVNNIVLCTWKFTLGVAVLL